MPRNYIRKKPDLAPVTQQQILKAKTLIDNGKSKRAAAKAIGISECSLRKRLKLNNVATTMGRFKPTFSEAQELEFAIHCKQMNDQFFGLAINDLRRLAFEYAAANNIENRFDKSSKMAGRDWVECFLKRNPQIVVRRSAATTKQPGFNKVQVNRFYINLKQLYEKYNFQPSRIYNVDETVISTVPIKTPKVLATKGKNISKIVSAEKGTITAVCCMSASGHYIPPALIYPRKRTRGDLLDGAPSQSVFMVSDSGYVNAEHFTNWLHHFKYFVHPTQKDPVLVILDNHSSHISLEAVKYARENNIVMLTLPPHGNNKLQPLDRCLYSQLKTNFAIECEKFMSQHPQRGVTHYHVARLFNEAYKKFASLRNAESGFKVTGIYPYDDDLLVESDFAPSSVTDQHQDRDREEPVEEKQATRSDAQNTKNPRDMLASNNTNHPAEVNMSADIDMSHIEFNSNNLSSVKNEIPEIHIKDDPIDDITPSPSIFVAMLEIDHGSEENMDNDDDTSKNRIRNENSNKQCHNEFETTNFEKSSIASPLTFHSSNDDSENRSGISEENIEEVNKH